MASGPTSSTKNSLGSKPVGSAPEVQDRHTLVADSIATGVVFALILTVGQRAIGFVRGLLFCRFMNEQQLGQWSLVWSFLMLLVPFAVLGLPGCFGKYTEHYRQRGQLGYFVKRIALFSGGLTLVAATSMLAMPATFSQIVLGSPEFTGIVYAMAFCLVMVSFSNIMVSLLESLRQVRMVTLMRFLVGILFSTVGLAMVVCFENAAIGATVGFGICSLIGVIPAFWLLRKIRTAIVNDGEVLGHSQMWTRVAPFAAWLWISNFLNNCFELSDRLMLLNCSPVSSEAAQGLVGQYHSGRTIPLMLISLAAILGGMLLPYLAAYWEKDERDKACNQLRWSLKLMALVFTAVGVCMLITAPFIFDTILQGRYDEGLAVLPMTLVYCIWFGLYTVGQDYMWVAEKGKFTALALLGGLLLNLLLNWLLIPSMGVSGAVLATTISNAFLVTVVYVFNHWLGCKSDFGIWFCALVPLILLLPVHFSIIASVLIAIAGWKTGVIFRAEEKQEVADSVAKLAKKFGGRS